MTTTATATAEFIITACVDHGTKATFDLNSARVYVELALADASTEHYVDHDGFASWACCPKMVVDPQGLFDPDSWY
jgi:hypothetical protein